MRFAILFLAASFASSHAAADPVLLAASGLPSGLGIFDITHFYQAESFTLTSPSTISSAIYWVYEGLSGSGIATPGLLNWIIYTNTPTGMPGTVLDSGTSSQAVLAENQSASPIQVHAPIGIGTPFETEFSLGQITLAAGTYWLALNQPSAPADPVGEWISTGIAEGSGFQTTNPPDGVWILRDSNEGFNFNEPTHLAFEVLGDVATPEPTSGILMFAGLLSLGLAYGTRRFFG